MRTTVTLDHDVARALERMQQQEGLGVSAALNVLARRGLAAPAPNAPPFVQRTSSMGSPRLPLDDIGSALEVLEGDQRGQRGQ